MLMAAVLLVQAAAGMGAAAPSPSPEALALGREIAEAGTLGTLLPLVQDKDVGELIAAHPELSAAEQARLRAVHTQVAGAAKARAFEAEARVFATRLTPDELRTVAAYNRSAAARAMRAALPEAIMGVMGALNGFDLKRETQAEFCRETGKLCAARR